MRKIKRMTANVSMRAAKAAIRMAIRAAEAEAGCYRLPAQQQLVATVVEGDDDRRVLVKSIADLLDARAHAAEILASRS